MGFSFQKLSGHELEPHLEELAKLRMTIFREFPYLYDGTMDYERKYLERYLNSNNSLVVLVKKGEEIVGASTCLPLMDEVEEIKQPFEEIGLNPSRTFYFGESLVYPKYRGHLLGHKFFEMREAHARKIVPELESTTFLAVDRELDHPRRPESYRELSNFWGRMGYREIEGSKLYFPWKDLDEDQESDKALSVWRKKWS